MNKQEFNRLAAEFLGYKEKLTWSGNAYIDEAKNRLIYRFDPYDDANDMLLIEEKILLVTNFNPTHIRWESYVYSLPYIGFGNTPHESRRACAEEYLKEWKK